MFTHHNTAGALTAALESALAANRKHIAAFRMRCVAVKEGGSWVNRFCVIQGFEKSEIPSVKNGIRDYGDVGFLQTIVKPTDVVRTVSEIANGQIEIGRYRLKTGTISGWTEEKNPSKNSYCEAPSTVFRGRPNSPPPGNEMSVIHYEHDCYPTLLHAMKAWSGLRSASVPSSSESGTVIVVVPEYRAALVDFSYKDGQLFATIERVGGAKDIALQMMWVRGGVVANERIAVTDRETALPDVHDAQEVYLWIMDSSGEVLDSHQEINFQPSESRKILRGDHINEKLTSIFEAVRSGEGERTEFKTYIVPGDPKMDEVLRTAVAFANSRGGRIFIGVDDNGQIEGLGREVGKFMRRNKKGRDQASPASKVDVSDEAQKQGCRRYAQKLRSILRSGITPDLEFEVDAVELAGQTIIVITIGEGLLAVYQWNKDRVAWVRHGANNMRADLHDWPRLLERRSPQGLNFAERLLR